MKKAKFFRYAALVLAAICALTLAGCPTDPDPDPEPDTALKGEWTNKVAGLHDGLVKDFTIDPDFTFEAKINPMFIGAYNQAYGTAYATAMGQGASEAVAQEAGSSAGLGALDGLLQQPGVTEANTRWTVTGKLTGEEDDIYVMSSLTETTGKPALSLPAGSTAAEELIGFNGQHVKISFTNDNKTAFKFESNESGELATQVTAFFGGDYNIK
jgi:hypothetical protein